MDGNLGTFYNVGGPGPYPMEFDFRSEVDIYGIRVVNVNAGDVHNIKVLGIYSRHNGVWHEELELNLEDAAEVEKHFFIPQARIISLVAKERYGQWQPWVREVYFNLAQ